MKKILQLIACSALPALALPLSAQSSDQTPLFGRWLTEKQDTIIRIMACENSLCGYIDWVHPEEDPLGPDGLPICGRRVLWGFNQSTSNDSLWVRGTILRPDEDKQYSGQIRHLGPEEISLRGYIGLPLLGKSYTLTRVRDDYLTSCL